MKITRIKACNLASLAGVVELDLQAGALGQAGLFAITGPTGSGKTTLLDAVCLALFDQTPRLLEADRRVKISRQGLGHEAIGAQSPQSLLRHDAGSGYAEVDFEGVDGRPFTARWEVRRAGDKPSGRIQPQKMRLTDRITEQELGSGTKSDTKRLIEEHLGLNFEQFTRSALLAQGQFASFLKASRNLRAELLERMTGTDLYAQISIQAFQKHKEAKDALQELEAKKLLLQLLTPIEAAELKASRSQAQDQVGRLEAERRERNARDNWERAVADTQRSVEKAQGEHNAAEAAWQAAEPQRSRLDHFLASGPKREAHKAVETARAELAQAQSKQGTQLSAQLSAKHKLQSAQAALEQAQATLEASSARATELSPSIKAALTLQERCATAAAAQTKSAGELLEAERRLRANAGELQRLRDQLRDAAGARDRAEAALAGQPQALALLPRWGRVQADLREISDLQAALAGSTSTQLEEEEAERQGAGAEAVLQEARAARRTKQEQLRALSAAPPQSPEGAQRALAHLEKEATLAEQLAELQSQFEQRREAEGTLRVDLEQDERQLPALRDASARAGELRALGESTLSLADHRARLVPGHACPLCGSKEHPGVDAGSVVIHTLKQEEDRARGALRAVELRHRETGARLKAAQQHLRESAESLAAKGQELTRLQLERQELVSPPVEPGTLSQQIQALQHTIRLQVDAHQAWQGSLQALEREFESADADLDKAEAAQQLAMHTLKQARDRSALRRDQAQSLSLLRSRLAHDLEGLPQFSPSQLEQPAALLERWQREVPIAQEHQDNLTRAKADTQELRAPIATKEERQTQAQLARDQHAREHQELVAHHAELEAERAALGIEAPLTLQAELEREQEEAHAKHQVAGRAHQQAKEQADRLEERVYLAQAAAAAAADKLKESEQALERVRGATSLAFLEELSAWDPAERHATQTRVKTLETALQTAKTILRERNDALRALKDAPPPAPTVDPAQAPLQERLAACYKRLSALELKLEQEQSNQRAAVGLAEEISSRRESARKWAVLKDLIGSANGDTFRQFAQGLTLETLVGHANLHLESLAPRYRLARVPGEDLELQIIDQALAGDVRSVNSLSGGETFLTSLALALGLASLASSKTPVRTLFIDEGFGSLDPKSLDTALATLDALQAGGRQVGIISHVAGIGDHIGVQVRVKPIAPGKSQVLVPT